ncbi:MAG: hypothetical protein IKO72_10525 [Kiritimatiellae bacterium]|nr:hypothetical protein [Kiritimatiellia bacterium]
MAEGTDIVIEEARELVSDRLLWPLVRDFLWDFAPQVHPSWVEDLFSSRDAETKLPRVKRYILSSLGVEPCFHVFPKDDYSRILLLDGATLESVVKWLGSLACADALRRVTDGATVRELKALLPGVYPEVFGYTMYFGGSVPRRDAETQNLKTVVVEEGSSLLLSALSGLPVPLVSRLKFKLPKDLASTYLAPRLAEASDDGRGRSDDRRENARVAIYKLLKLRFPEAYKLCCS